MSNRITVKNLQAVVDRINRELDRPLEPYTKQPDGTYKANLGCYHLDSAYGGYALHCLDNDSGGVRDTLGGHMPKATLYEALHAFLCGVSALREQRK